MRQFAGSSLQQKINKTLAELKSTTSSVDDFQKTLDGAYYEKPESDYYEKAAKDKIARFYYLGAKEIKELREYLTANKANDVNANTKLEALKNYGKLNPNSPLPGPSKK